jgi:hypothetical protein
MHSFVVVSQKPGRVVPDSVSAFLHQPDTADLGFVPEDHVCWRDDAGTVLFAGWQSSKDAVRFGSHWHIGERGITAFSGRLWPKGGMWNTDETWAAQLERYWRARPIVCSGQEFDGIYAAASISSSGTGAVVTDALSVALLYRTETDDFVAFSTSARLAARVGAPPDRKPQRDPLTVAWLPLLGYVVGDGTGFVGTRVLPAGAYVDIGPAFGARLGFTNATPWASPDLPVNESALVDLVHDDLTRSVRSVALLPARERFADLTGGRDSRLLLALMLQEGVADRFLFRTNGAEHTPDSVVGRAIAERFGLSHEAVTPAPMDETAFRRRLETHVFHTSGMLNPWDFKGGLDVARRPKVSGFFGEMLSTNYKGFPELGSRDALRTVFHKREKIDSSSILRPDVKVELLDRLDEELIGRMDACGSAPQDLLDSFYVRQRIRRWFGTFEELGESGRIFPLYSVVGLQAACALGAPRRRLEVLAFAIMRKACSDLTKMPLANKPWPEALVSHLPDADDYRVAPETYAGPAPVHWQIARIVDNRETVEGYLLDEKQSPLFDIIDRGSLERALRDPLPTAPLHFRQLFGALAAAVWLGHGESQYRIGMTWDQPIEPDRSERGRADATRAVTSDRRTPTARPGLLKRLRPGARR